MQKTISVQRSNSITEYVRGPRPRLGKALAFANIDANAWHISDPAIGAGSQKSVRRVRLARLRLRSSIYIYSYTVYVRSRCSPGFVP